MRVGVGLLAALAGLPGFACGGEQPALFERRDDLGLDVELVSGGNAAIKETILEVNGNGIALADLDDDGRLDLVLVDGSTRAALLAGTTVQHHVFRNREGEAGAPRFERASGETGLSMSGWPAGIAQGDIDGDGRIDLLIGGLGADALFLNRSSRADDTIRFERRELPGRSTPRDWTTSVALADADGDGFLDAYLCRYLDIDPVDPPLHQVGDLPCRWRGHAVMCGPHGLPPQTDVFLRGDGQGGFRDESERSGVAAAGRGFALGVIFADLDGDGRPDLYVANDSVPNLLLANVGDGRFEDRSALSGAATDLAGRPQAGMGVDVADFDRDGDLDLVVTNFSEESVALYRNDGGLLFRDVAAAAGVGAASRPTLGWGVHLADFDGDGRADLYVSNGHVYPQADRPGTATSYAQAQQFWRGVGAGRFGPESFPETLPWRGRSSARGDLDGDGDLDLVTTTLDGRPRIYLCRTDAPERQLLVTLLSGDSLALGATLRLETDDGPFVAAVLSSAGFQTSNDPRLHLAGEGEIRDVVVTWSEGSREVLLPGALRFGQHVTIRRGAGVVASQPLPLASGSATR